MFSKLIQHHRSLLALSAAAVLGLSVGLPAAQAELRQVKQTIYGMDCAPCAYGMQKNLGKLEGVTEVEVSLNNANAVIGLAPDNQVSLKDIRRVVRNGGFKPHGAKVWAIGTIQLEGDRIVLATEDGAEYRLRTSDEVRQAALKPLQGAEVLVKAEVPAEGERLVVQDAAKLREATGELSRQGDRFILTTSSDRRYVLQPVKAAARQWQMLKQADGNARVTVQGVVADGGQEPSTLKVWSFTTQRHAEHEPPRAESSRAVIGVEGMACTGCAQRLEGALTGLPGVGEALVGFATKQATVKYDGDRTSRSEVAERIREAGFTPEAKKAAGGS